MKRGKQERYIKDEGELTKYLLDASLEDARLETGRENQVITGDELRELAESYYRILGQMQRLERVYPLLALENMIHMPRLSVSDLDDSKLVEAWTQQLSSFSGRC